MREGFFFANNYEILFYDRPLLKTKMGNFMFHFFENTEKLKKEKLERLYLAYRRRMYYIAFQLLHDEMEAEDVVHDAFFIIKERLDDVDEKNCHKTMSFFAVIVKHLALDKIRKRQKEIYPEPGYFDHLPAHEESREDRETVSELLSLLPFAQREIVVMKYVHDFSNAKIADILGISEENVRQRLHRAVQKIKEERGKPR